MYKSSIAHRAGIRQPIAWISPVSGGQGVYLLMRESFAFQPANVGQGDRIGSLTVISEPWSWVRYSDCSFIEHPERFAVPYRLLDTARELAAEHRCPGPITHTYADVRCDCGTEIKDLKLTGDRYQWIACPACFLAIRNAYVARSVA